MKKKRTQKVNIDCEFSFLLKMQLEKEINLFRSKPYNGVVHPIVSYIPTSKNKDKTILDENFFNKNNLTLKGITFTHANNGFDSYQDDLFSVNGFKHRTYHTPYYLRAGVKTVWLNRLNVFEKSNRLEAVKIKKPCGHKHEQYEYVYENCGKLDLRLHMDSIIIHPKNDPNIFTPERIVTLICTREIEIEIEERPNFIQRLFLKLKKKKIK